MSSGAFNRKLYQFKSHIGASSKTKDSDVQFAKNKVEEMKKKFKNIETVVKKLSATLHATNLMQVEVLTSVKDTIFENDTMTDNIDKVISTYQRIDEGVEAYQTKIEEDILSPLRTFTEQFKIMEKRFDVCHTRRVDMDRYHERVLDISKKPAAKQTGLPEAQSKYNRSRDLYNYLKNELIYDVEQLSTSFENVVSPICGTLIVCYTNYINHLNDNWGTATQLCANFRICKVDPTHVITPTEVSMVSEANVQTAKNNDVSNGKKDDSSSSSSDDGKKKSTNAAVASSVKKPAPPPPSRGPKKEQVRCEYDYQASESNELSFKEGDIITVLKKEGDWWLGELKGKQGLFPYNYVSAL